MSEAPFDLHSFPSREAADRALAKEVTDILIDAIKDRGQASLVVSGGSTPIGLFRLLSKTHLPWQQVSITLADDRMLDAAHPDSNARLVRDHLMRNGASSARFLPLFSDAGSSIAEVHNCERLIRDLGCTDAVILGMGGDGHTASLFPGTPSLKLGLDMASRRHCIAVTPPVAPYYRLSQTLPALLNTGRVFLHFYGRDKLNVLTAAQTESQPERYPISAVLHQQLAPVSIYYAD